MSDDDDRDDDDLKEFLDQWAPDPAPAISRPQLPEPDDDPLEFLEAMSRPYQDLKGPVVACMALDARALEMLEPRLPLGNLRTVEYAHELLQRGPYGLADVMAWKGDDCAGIVTLYYTGPADQRLIADPNSRLPLVVGSDNDCIKRLKGFVASIQQVGLGIENFTVRFLPLSEKVKEDAKKCLNEMYLPLWDTFDGFLARQYAPDSRGSDSTRSRWDTVFGGRIGAGTVERGEDLLTQVSEEIPNCLARFRRCERQLAAFRFLSDGGQS